MRYTRLSYLILIIGVFFLSTSAIFVKLAKTPSSIIAFYRLTFTTLTLLPLLVINKNVRKELFSVTRRQLFLGLISGMFLALHYVLWFESLNYTTVASSTVIVTLQPIFSVVGCYYLFNERLNRSSIIGIIIAILGSFIIGWGDFKLDKLALLGDFLALFSTSLISIYFLIGQRLRQSISVITYSLIGYISSSLLLFIYVFIKKLSLFDYPKFTWIMFIGLALISTLLGQMLINWVIKWLSASVVSVGILGETIWASIFSYFILKENISVHQLIGIGIILIGLVIFSIHYKSGKVNVD